MIVQSRPDRHQQWDRRDESIGATPARRAGRLRSRPRVEVLEIRRLLSGGPPITEFPIPPGGAPVGIAAGPDGALWFTKGFGNQIGRITTTGAVSEYPIPTNGSNPWGIAAGPDGALWFTENYTNLIGRITTSGAVTEYPTPTANSGPIGITSGPDGALWFTEVYGNRIGRITTAGAITEYPIPTALGDPQGIAAGPDGALWFTEVNGDRIGRITTAGAVTEYPIPTTSSFPMGIAAGPDGALWFTENGSDRIGRITTAGAVTEYPIPTALSDPLGIAAGPDGTLWFTDIGANRIGRITTTGAITEYPTPTSSSDPDAIAAGPDDNLWFTENDVNQIGRLTFPPAATGKRFKAIEGTPFDGAVASFTDPGRTPGDYRATIDWGDGTTTAGTIAQDADGVYYVNGHHIFTQPGSDNIAVTILDDVDGGTATVASITAVSPPPLVGQAVPLLATEGSPIPGSTLLATFTATDGAVSPSDYAATISWGDGATSGAIVQQSGADLEVSSAAPHTYAEEGTYPVEVTITNTIGPPVTVESAGTATVADAPLTPAAVLPGLAVTKGVPLADAEVAVFNDADPKAPTGEFAATIDWGDGSPPSVGKITQPGGVGTAFQVQGSHTYADDRAAPYPITVTIRDQGGAGLVMTSQATVADAAPMVSGIPVQMTKGVFFAAPVAYIVEANGATPEPPSHYRATINWGDGTAATAGTIEAIPGGDWVVGSHTYSGKGPYTITITVYDVGGLAVTATVTAFDPPARPAGPRHRAARQEHHRHGDGGTTVASPITTYGPPSGPAGPRSRAARRDHHHLAGPGGRAAARLAGTARPRRVGMPQQPT